MLINQNENLYSSREPSPVQLGRDRVTNKDSAEADFDSFDKDLYLQKVLHNTDKQFTLINHTR